MCVKVQLVEKRREEKRERDRKRENDKEYRFEEKGENINADLRAPASSYFSFIDFPFRSGRWCESVIREEEKKLVKGEEDSG